MLHQPTVLIKQCALLSRPAEKHCQSRRSKPSVLQRHDHSRSRRA